MNLSRIPDGTDYPDIIFATSLRHTSKIKEHDLRIVTNPSHIPSDSTVYVTKFTVRSTHSFCSLSYHRSRASSKANSPYSAIYCFLLQFPGPALFLKVINSFLRLLPYLPVTSTLPSFFPSITCIRRQFLRKMWQIHLVFLLLIVLGYFSPPWLCVPLLHFSHNRSNWSLHPSSKIATNVVLNAAIINYVCLVRFYDL